MIPESSLDCHSCKLAIPFCIVSGKHIVADDYTGAQSHSFLIASVDAEHSALNLRLTRRSLRFVGCRDIRDSVPELPLRSGSQLLRNVHREERELSDVRPRDRAGFRAQDGVEPEGLKAHLIFR